ncbi:antiterminator Q family protein [Escherichia coli]
MRDIQMVLERWGGWLNQETSCYMIITTL